MFGININDWKDLNGFNTATEIFQQPELWLETLNIVESQKEKINKFINERLDKDNTRVIFTGAGTSAYVGSIVASHINRKNNYLFESIPTTDIVANPEIYLKKRYSYHNGFIC